MSSSFRLCMPLFNWITVELRISISLLRPLTISSCTLARLSVSNLTWSSRDNTLYIYESSSSSLSIIGSILYFKIDSSCSLSLSADFKSDISVSSNSLSEAIWPSSAALASYSFFSVTAVCSSKSKSAFKASSSIVFWARVAFVISHVLKAIESCSDCTLTFFSAAWICSNKVGSGSCASFS